MLLGPQKIRQPTTVRKSLSKTTINDLASGILPFGEIEDILLFTGNQRKAGRFLSPFPFVIPPFFDRHRDALFTSIAHIEPRILDIAFFCNLDLVVTLGCMKDHTGPPENPGNLHGGRPRNCANHDNHTYCMLYHCGVNRMNKVHNNSIISNANIDLIGTCKLSGNGLPLT